MKVQRQWLLLIGVLLLPVMAIADADLSITNTTMPNPATVGKNLTYGMNVINNSPDMATNVQVTDALPAGVTLVSASFNFIAARHSPQDLA